MEIAKILLVDDDEDIRAIGEISLHDVGGWETALAADASEAVRVAKSFRPDVILLDVMMPGTDGPGTLNLLRDTPETADIPVVFLTAKSVREDLDALRALGPAGMIAKPFDPMELPQRIREIFL